LRAWIFVFCVCCVLCMQRSVRRVDQPFRGFLLAVWSQHWGGLDHSGCCASERVETAATDTQKTFYVAQHYTSRQPLMEIVLKITQYMQTVKPRKFFWWIRKRIRAICTSALRTAYHSGI
jgi:hypothetical protein